jgi:hypothetical protein
MELSPVTVRKRGLEATVCWCDPPVLIDVHSPYHWRFYRAKVEMEEGRD